MLFLNRWIEKKTDDELFNWVKICALVHAQIVVYGNIKETVNKPLQGMAPTPLPPNECSPKSFLMFPPLSPSPYSPSP